MVLENISPDGPQDPSRFDYNVEFLFHLNSITFGSAGAVFDSLIHHHDPGFLTGPRPRAGGMGTYLTEGGMQTMQNAPVVQPQ